MVLVHVVVGRSLVRVLLLRWVLLVQLDVATLGHQGCLAHVAALIHTLRGLMMDLRCLWVLLLLLL